MRLISEDDEYKDDQDENNDYYEDDEEDDDDYYYYEEEDEEEEDEEEDDYEFYCDEFYVIFIISGNDYIENEESGRSGLRDDDEEEEENQPFDFEFEIVLLFFIYGQSLFLSINQFYPEVQLSLDSTNPLEVLNRFDLDVSSEENKLVNDDEEEEIEVQFGQIEFDDNKC
ncbi:MAG: hypothetical protein EZS28_039587 [Streblomastix strix]|uniref:Uncharacterized protein n=1 Tax=Streblomastix strix TaxID=222440 RepID=A0A5J4U2B5_9EUKA|nr:MAG: hypothetical protein EZS28_039587 [Streblomastix strix]